MTVAELKKKLAELPLTFEAWEVLLDSGDDGPPSYWNGAVSLRSDKNAIVLETEL